MISFKNSLTLGYFRFLLNVHVKTNQTFNRTAEHTKNRFHSNDTTAQSTIKM